MERREEYLILIADDDELLSNLISESLLDRGYKSAIACDGKEALEMFNALKPHVVIADVRMPVMSGLDFLKETRKSSYTTPVIITTGHPDMETAISSIQYGAFDYIVKPIEIDVLIQKVEQALKSTRLTRESAILTELASLHKITQQLSNTHDLPELLKVTLECCLEVSDAEVGSIQLVDRETNELVIMQQRGVVAPSARSSLDADADPAISAWVFKTGQSLLVSEGKIYPPVDIVLDRTGLGSSLSVPLKRMDETIGVVNLSRKPGRDPFSIVHLNTIDVLAAQAGIAISNADLYSSIHQKLSELSLISNYSEKLMGLIDKEDIMKCLFETVEKHFVIDFISYFGAYKRSFEFLYWCRGKLADEDGDTVLDEICDEYSRATKSKVQKKRVMKRRFALGTPTETLIRLPFKFTHKAALALEEVEFGMLYFGSARDLDNESEKVALLASLVNQTRIALTNSRLYSDMKENYIRTIKALAIAVDAKDTYTHGHSENVMQIAEAMAREMGMDEKTIGTIRDGALLHDIGKIGVPGYILNKPGALTYEEFNGIMKTHPSLGATIVRDVPFLRDLYELILCHHENWDGTGYPQGQKGSAIPAGARILHVADAFEAMTSNRPYRNSLGRQEAFKRLREERGKQFEPDAVDAFFRVADKKGWLTDDTKSA
jgi:putative nucleotidyltransferase with HDIG domain